MTEEDEKVARENGKMIKLEQFDDTNTKLLLTGNTSTSRTWRRMRMMGCKD